MHATKCTISFFKYKRYNHTQFDAVLLSLIHVVMYIYKNLPTYFRFCLKSRHFDIKVYFGKCIYQSPLILTELFQHNLINGSYLTACYLYQVMMTLHFLNDDANDA